MASQKALQARIATLQQRLGGGNWLDAAGRARRAEKQAESKAASAQADQQKLKELLEMQKIGPRMREEGAKLLSQMNSNNTSLKEELATSTPTSASEVGLTERWADALTAFIEQQLFYAGKGDVARTKLLAAARPAMQRLLDRQDARGQRLLRALEAMVVASAHGVLGHLLDLRRPWHPLTSRPITLRGYL